MTMLPSCALTSAAGVLLLSAQVAAAGPPQAAARPGPIGEGVTLLPNGWRIAPAGRHLDVGDLPLAMAVHPDGRHVVITNNGWSKPSLRVVDLERRQVIQKLPLDNAWLGLAWHPDGKRLYSSGAADNSIQEVEWRGDRLALGRKLVVASPQTTKDERLMNAGFMGGLAVSADGRTLYAAQVYGKAVVALDLETGAVLARRDLPAEAYTAVLAPDGRAVYVSVWGGARVAVLEPKTLAPVSEIGVGEHPNAMLFSKDGRRLFVACANTNAVYALDLVARQAVERIGVALSPKAPPGSTPNALALSADGRTLLVANADNNTVAVVDVTQAGESRFLGFIPTGWYPTGVAFDRDGENLLVLSGKGLTPVANPRGPQPVATRDDSSYIAALLNGALSIVKRPDSGELAKLTARVFAISAYNDGRRDAPPGRPDGSPIPGRVGEPSPIKHVFYVIRENRTYDQVLGDLPQGNGDPNLTLFGEDVTPNAHAIAREFVLFDNFYVDAEVSNDGHAFSTAAYATDAVEKLWPTLYGQRGGLYLSEGGHEIRNNYGNLAAPAEGYLWDFAARAGVSVRSYGEFASWETKGGADHGDGARPRRQGPPELRALRPVDPRQPEDRRVARGVPPLREGGRAAAAQHHPPRQRPHRRHLARPPHAARLRRGERPGTRPAGRGDLEEPLLAGVGRIRARGRRPERPRPRGRAPLGAAGGEPVGEARQRRLDALHDFGCAPHDRARARAAADEPVRRGGDARFRGFPHAARLATLPGASGWRAARRDEPARRSWSTGLAADEPDRSRPRAGARAQRDRLEVGPRPGLGDAAARAGSLRQADSRGRRRRRGRRRQGRDPRREAAVEAPLDDRSSRGRSVAEQAGDPGQAARQRLA